MQDAVEQVSPAETAEALDKKRDAVYLDVRTVEEFELGHVPGSLNIPFALPDAATGMTAQNRRFAEVAAAVLHPSQTVYCGCATGLRSHYAAAILLSQGFPQVFNVDTGFSGKHDMLGRMMEPGWEALGLPVARGNGGAGSYATLAELTEAAARAAGRADEASLEASAGASEEAPHAPDPPDPEND